MIQINDEWRLAADERCVRLEQLRVSDPDNPRTKPGAQPRWVTIGYYRDIPAAIGAFRRHSELDALADTLDGMWATYESRALALLARVVSA